MSITGDDHFLLLIFDTYRLIFNHHHLSDRIDSLIDLICVALRVTAVPAAHLFHGLGVDVVKVDQFIKGLQLNWWGPQSRRCGGRYWDPPTDQLHLRLLFTRSEEQLWVNDVQNAQKQIRLKGEKTRD